MAVRRLHLEYRLVSLQLQCTDFIVLQYRAGLCITLNHILMQCIIKATKVCLLHSLPRVNCVEVRGRAQCVGEVMCVNSAKMRSGVQYGVVFSMGSGESVRIFSEKIVLIKITHATTS